MNKEYNANYEDRIEFVIALMTKNYAKACEVGNHLLRRNPEDGNVISVLNILKQKKYHETNACGRSSSIEDSIETDSECEASDVNNDCDADSVDDNTNVLIDSRVMSKIISHNTVRWSNNKGNVNLDFKQKMHRVIPIRVNRKLKNK